MEIDPMTQEHKRPRGRQTERRLEAENKLLVAAAELIGEVGPTRMTFNDIGTRAGYSRGLASHHFGSKNALIRRIMDKVTEDFHRDLAAHDPDPADVRDGIREIVLAYYRGLGKSDPMIRARVALWAAAAVEGSEIDRSHVAAAEERFKDEIRTRISKGIRSEQIPGDLDTEGFTTVLIAMLRGVAVQLLLDNSVDLDRAAAETLAFVDGRLARRPQAKPT
ncbi:TetR/AcrR family transcriptional regulator [Mycobacterium sp. NAZ190054]|uniref:TetR/AcrR family transcriptional regulator n=1 Tax=Mycobacterium sp. NAZ190054 TaxID=1747766 RepID=UPI000798F6CE|nr:TetR/AcrR family transcriptional regulator [Mycobacterium sp. NAZ190054]KWX57581.1 hypothetical protein ASJ79_11150 [Mycobacterium sp. NAZ190054]